MAGGSRVMVGWGMPAIGRHGSEDHITPRCYNHPEGTHAGLAKNTAYSRRTADAVTRQLPQGV
jgi:hypothetical protein